MIWSLGKPRAACPACQETTVRPERSLGRQWPSPTSAGAPRVRRGTPIPRTTPQTGPAPYSGRLCSTRSNSRGPARSRKREGAGARRGGMTSRRVCGSRAPPGTRRKGPRWVEQPATGPWASLGRPATGVTLSSLQAWAAELQRNKKKPPEVVSSWLHALDWFQQRERNRK